MRFPLFAAGPQLECKSVGPIHDSIITLPVRNQAPLLIRAPISTGAVPYRLIPYILVAESVETLLVDAVTDEPVVVARGNELPFRDVSGARVDAEVVRFDGNARRIVGFRNDVQLFEGCEVSLHV